MVVRAPGVTGHLGCAALTVESHVLDDEQLDDKQDCLLKVKSKISTRTIRRVEEA